MKKLIITIGIFIVVTKTTYAQVYVQGGLNLANITNTNDGQTEKNNILPSFNVGILGRYSLLPRLSLESGILFSGHGSKAETYFYSNSNYVKTRFNPYYIQVPLNAVIKIPIQRGSNIFFNAGPYAAIGITGKSKQEVKVGPFITSTTNNIKFSNDDPFTSQQDDAAYDKLKRFDFGLNFGGGFDFGPVIVKVNYGLGLTKINSTEDSNNENDRNKYRTLSISLGVPLGK